MTKTFFSVFLRNLHGQAPVFLILLFFAACNRSKSNGDRFRAVGLGRSFTMEQLTNLITIGMSMTEVTNILGEPIKIPGADSNVVYIYNFPIRPEPEPLHVGGLSIQFVNGLVAQWKPIMSETTKLPDSSSNPKDLGMKYCEVYITAVTNSDIVNMTIDDKRIAPSIKTVPDMAFYAEMVTDKSNNGSPAQQTVTLNLNESDASKLKEFTAANLEKRLLFVVNHKIIAAPLIITPIESKSIILHSNY